MTGWSLDVVLAAFHKEVQSRLDSARATFAHPGTKGDASEAVWIDLFNRYLPARYSATKCHIVDSRGSFSDQIDVVIFDRH